MNLKLNLVAMHTIVRKEMIRVLRIWVQTIVPPAITMTLYFIIFGNLIGRRIGTMDGIDYMAYIAPGLIMMSVITNSYGNVVSSFFGAKFGRHIEEMIVSPMSNATIIIGHVVGGVLRGLLVGLLVTVVALFFTRLEVQHPLVTISIGLQSIDRSHLDAAATMGATEMVSFRTVVLPQTVPYTISGFFFVLVLSFNEFIVMFFVSASSYATVTLQIFNSLRNGYTPTMAVAAITFIAISVLVFSAVARWGDLPRLMGADQSRN